MKRNERCRIMVGVLVALALVCSLWSTQAMAYNYTITGYTGSFLINDGGTLDTIGKYTINLTGGALVNNHVDNLKGSISLISDDGIAFDYSALLIDSFFLDYTDSVFTLGSLENGNMIQLLLGAATMDPEIPIPVGVNVEAAKNLGNGYVYVNQIYEDGVNGYFSYDEIGALTDPVKKYGHIYLPGFLATDTAGNLVDMDIDDASVPVPEPSTVLLIGGGLAGLAFWRRRKA